MPAPDLYDSFHRSLHARLSSLLEERIIGLSEGTAAKITSDTQSVAEKYAAQVAYIKAVRDVLDICLVLEEERYGPRDKRVAPGED